MSVSFYVMIHDDTEDRDRPPGPSDSEFYCLRSQFKFNQCALVDANSIDEFYDAMVGFINWFYPGTF